MNTLQLKIFNTYLRWKTRNIRADMRDKYNIPWTLILEDSKTGFREWQYSMFDCQAKLSLSWSDNNEFVTLSGIFIHDHRYRGRGIGSQLINKAKALTVELGKVGLVGWVSDEQVLGGLRREHPQPYLLDWYRHHGFEVTMTLHSSDSARIADICWRAETEQTTLVGV
ncbi:MAG: hypothetical protein ACPG8W_01575 [Candidatus Promineifilaceae bacterium]